MEDGGIKFHHQQGEQDRTCDDGGEGDVKKEYADKCCYCGEHMKRTCQRFLSNPDQRNDYNGDHSRFQSVEHGIDTWNI